jgi:hypothetical protein
LVDRHPTLAAEAVQSVGVRRLQERMEWVNPRRLAWSSSALRNPVRLVPALQVPVVVAGSQESPSLRLPAGR